MTKTPLILASAVVYALFLALPLDGWAQQRGSGPGGKGARGGYGGHGSGAHVRPPAGTPPGASHYGARPGRGVWVGARAPVYRGGYPGWRGGYWGAPVGWGAGWAGWNAGWRWGAGWGWAPGWYGYGYGYGAGYGAGWPWWGAWPWGVSTLVVSQAATINVDPAWGDPTPQTRLFVEQDQAPADAAPSTSAAVPATSPGGHWYYCTAPAGYFPYVKDCSEPWLKVIPAPPGQQPSLAVQR